MCEFAVALDSLCSDLETSAAACKDTIFKKCNVKVGPSESTNRLGLIATKAISKGEVMVSMPYDDRAVLTADLARDVFKDVLQAEFDGWTGDTGLIALLILNEVALAATSQGGGVEIPNRDAAIQTFMDAWVQSLPSPEEMKQQHPILWSEDDQEILQSSSSSKLYRTLDDIEDDADWFEEYAFDYDREAFPESVTWNGYDGDKSIPCFSLEGYKWAMAIAKSRQVFVDKKIRLFPLMDMCNHADDGVEVAPASMGPFFTVKGAQLVATKKYKAGEEVFCSYGPKSAADYLLEHGFCPAQCWKTSVSELTFELDPDGRFYDDKLDILEFETYEDDPMEPSQSFDVVSAPGLDGAPDPAMIQFARLCKLGGSDGFLLESVFRKEVWGFMSMPVSEGNEKLAFDIIIDSCQDSLDDLSSCPEGGPEVCTKLRESESRALTRTLEYLQREKEALDLKEYYQERRLKDLGLNSDWSPEEESVDPDLNFGQTRAPGGDFDW